MSSQMQKHLRFYVEEAIKQKVMLNNSIDAYLAQESKTRERIIDETTLEQDYILRGFSQERINAISERLNMDLNVMENIKRIIEELREQRKLAIIRVNSHLEELTDIEISIGGFVTHSIAVDKKATLDKEKNIVQIQPEGNIDIPIATRLNKWKDSSQLTIKKIKIKK